MTPWILSSSVLDLNRFKTSIVGWYIILFYFFTSCCFQVFNKQNNIVLTKKKWFVKGFKFPSHEINLWVDFIIMLTAIKKKKTKNNLINEAKRIIQRTWNRGPWRKSAVVWFSIWMGFDHNNEHEKSLPTNIKMTIKLS